MAISHLERMKQAILAGDEQALEQLGQEHGFLSESTMECHKDNVSIMRRELLGGEGKERDDRELRSSAVNRGRCPFYVGYAV
ncbi:hypothetical protein ACTHPM_13720 [Paenibacillus sp. SAFN-054]